MTDRELESIPGEPADHPARRATWGLKDIILAGIVTLVVMLAAALVLALVWFAANAAGLPVFSMRTLALAVLALEAIMIGPAWLFGPARHGGGWRALGLRAYSPLKTGALVLGGLLLVLLINAGWEPLRQALGLEPQPDVIDLFGGGVAGLLLALLLGGVVAPVAEEIFFRGFVYAGLRSRWGLVWGLVASSLIFSLVHVTPGVLVPIFLMGLVLAYLYEISGSIWPSIALHAAINSLAFIGAYLATQAPATFSGF